MIYNIWNAVAYEVTNLLIDMDPRWEINKWVMMIRSYCFQDWVEWKTERTMKRVDKQVDDIQQKWEQEDRKTYIEPVTIEHKPDDSKAQQLLGGELQMQAPWYKALFPETRLSADKNQESNYETTKRGYRYATSVGGTLTGRGGNLIIIDDPLKPEDAMSQTKREAVNAWYSRTCSATIKVRMARQSR